MNITTATALCKHFEGFRSRPYLCPAGVVTIGYGSTRYLNGQRITMQDIEITESQAEELLIAELKRCASAVNRLCPALLPEAVVNNNWGRFNAAVDFVYNLGAGRLQTSTLRRKINARVWYGAKVELMKWVRGGGRVLPGLVLRRKAECELI